MGRWFLASQIYSSSEVSSLAAPARRSYDSQSTHCCVHVGLHSSARQSRGTFLTFRFANFYDRGGELSCDPRCNFVEFTFWRPYRVQDEPICPAWAGQHLLDRSHKFLFAWQGHRQQLEGSLRLATAWRRACAGASAATAASLRPRTRYGYYGKARSPTPVTERIPGICGGHLRPNSGKCGLQMDVQACRNSSQP